MKILLMGYYGYKNIGDDIFVKQLTDYLGQKESVEEIFVIVQEDYYTNLNPKTQFLSAANLSRLKRIYLIWKNDFIAWGGGTLNLASKPTNLLRMQKFSQLMGKRFGFLGIGLESISTESKKGINTVFKKADMIYVRDKYSYDFIKQQLQYKKTCYLGGDLAFLNLSFYEKFISRTNKNSQLKRISFCGKTWWGQGRAEFYAQQLMPLIKNYNSIIHLLPGQNLDEEKNDNRFHKLLKSCLPDQHCKIHSWEKPEDFMEILSQMDFHIGNRLHSIILADILGVPNIGIGNSFSKIANYINKTQMLPSERIAAFMEPISVERIEQISQSYKRPNKFILNESSMAKNCLEKIFNFQQN